MANQGPNNILTPLGDGMNLVDKQTPFNEHQNNVSKISKIILFPSKLNSRLLPFKLMLINLVKTNYK